ncbi:hypothetical protein PsYK624_119120 [Phanerochaete sordida]|uniref:Uncharacterized protein n=1 Tax=Phanerochaete sordida TaxID=48140 RepID=A0A9P3LHN7_9APHY|nr:hypothetical protein PsYK624_119120 [Phanerochaete sordida]
MRLLVLFAAAALFLACMPPPASARPITSAGPTASHPSAPHPPHPTLSSTPSRTGQTTPNARIPTTKTAQEGPTSMTAPFGGAVPIETAVIDRLWGWW